MPGTFFASSRVFSSGLRALTSKGLRISFCTTSPQGKPTTGWKTGASVMKAKSSSQANLCAAMGSTTNGWTVKVSSCASAAGIAVSSSGKIQTAVIYTSSSHVLFVTKVTSQLVKGTDTVKWPKFNIRISNPTSS